MSDNPSSSGMDGSTLGLLAGCTIIGLTTLVIGLCATGLRFSGDPRVDWETLVVGATAVLAAWFTVRKLSAQIQEARRQNETIERLATEDVARQNQAARALLPVALAALCDYAEACASILIELLPDDANERAVDKRPSQVPTLPEYIASVFASAIRFASPKNALALADILTALQIQHSRLRGLLGKEVVLTLTVYRFIIDAAEVYAAAAAAFDYGRRQSEAIDLAINQRDVQNALLQLRAYDIAGVSELMKRWAIEDSVLHFSAASAKK